MKRAPIVLGTTALGLAGVIGYHTTAPSLTSTKTSAVAATSAAATTGQSSSGSGATSPGKSSTTSSSSAAATSTPKKTSTRTATGEDVNYRYGDLQVKVTKSGTRISDVSVVKLDVADPHSQSIDQEALPQLTQQAESAQSAKIDGVSGASYTSAAYEQSLQSALDKLA